jgi:hypothetical protein
VEGEESAKSHRWRVRGVYNRAEYADQRKAMLQFWGDYIDELAVVAICSDLPGR